jgi:hypothetical protein
MQETGTGSRYELLIIERYNELQTRICSLPSAREIGNFRRKSIFYYSSKISAFHSHFPFDRSHFLSMGSLTPKWWHVKSFAHFPTENKTSIYGKIYISSCDGLQRELIPSKSTHSHTHTHTNKEYRIYCSSIFCSINSSKTWILFFISFCGLNL